jgi:maltooligosyltrehalose trehalohydrolase
MTLEREQETAPCWQMPVGAQVDERGVRFRVWAREAKSLEVVLFDLQGQETASYPLNRDDVGYFLGHVEGLKAGAHYMYRLDGEKLRPDPASRCQPVDVHGVSEVVDPGAFQWSPEAQKWLGLPLEQLVIYEVHIGTATPEGTFDSLIEKLDYIKGLGVTAIEIMPVADFPGKRNWGYDGVDLFAPSCAYGGPQALRRLVDAAHLRGLAVIQDVVYNHLGPDGNYLRDFSKEYFTDQEKTPWGDAINYNCREVREFFIANAMHWAHEYHMDGLRLDATHAILDHSPEHFLQEMARRVRESLSEDRHFVLIAEDERNEAKLVQPVSTGGIGLDAVWADDFHHQVRSALAGDNEGYYADFTGSAEDLAETLSKGWFYAGQLSKFSGKNRGTNAEGIDPAHFVYCIQNHDQIGNRAMGDRLTDSISLEAYRAASALLLLSPYTPLLFQGQEWAASNPFLFFTDHNPELGKLVTKGRREEFSHFSGFNAEQVPDPQALSTFEASKLNWNELEQGKHSQVLELYRDLLSLRCKEPYLKNRSRQSFTAAKIDQDAIALRYQSGNDPALLIVVNLKGDLNLQLDGQSLAENSTGKGWELLLSTNCPRYGGEEDLIITQQKINTGKLSMVSPVCLVLKAL